MRAALYARYSSDNQREESIFAQIRAGREYCKRKKYTIVREYKDEAFTARTDNRPDFQKMMRDAKTGLFDVIIFHKIDRNARDEYDYYRYKSQLKKLGISIEYVTQNIDDSPEGSMMESMLVGMAAYYSRNLSVEVKKGMRENAYQAKHNGGTPPLGYEVKDGKYIINESEAAIVRFIFEKRASGSGYINIINELNLKGFKTKRGSQFGKNSLHDLLKNKKYIGVYSFGRVAGGHTDKRNSHKTDENMIEIPDAIPAIISKELWNKVQQQMIESKRSPGSHTAKEEYLLSGLIYCGECGAKMVGSRVTSRGNKYVYYRCDRQQRQNSCGNSRIKKEDVEKEVLAFIEKEYLDPDKISELTAEINKAIASKLEEYETNNTHLLKEKENLTKRISNLLNALEEGESIDLIRERLTENKRKLSEIESQLLVISQKQLAVYLSEDQVSETVNSLSAKDKSPEQVRAMLKMFVDKIIVKQNELEIKLRFALDWWRRGESNSCPKVPLHRLLRAQSAI